MSKEFEEIVLKKLDNLETEVKDNSQRLENLETEVKNNTRRLGKLEIEVKDTGESLLELRQRFTIFDFEINRKIDTLFDSDTVNKENIVSLNVKNYNHDTRISNLENKDLSFVKL